MYNGTQGSERRSSAMLIGAVAQLGERLLCKQEVVGSIPSSSTSLQVFSLSSSVRVSIGCRHDSIHHSRFGRVESSER